VAAKALFYFILFYFIFCWIAIPDDRMSFLNFTSPGFLLFTLLFSFSFFLFFKHLVPDLEKRLWLVQQKKEINSKGKKKKKEKKKEREKERERERKKNGVRAYEK